MRDDLQIEVVHDGVTHLVTPTAGAMIVLERKYGKPAAELFAMPSMEHLAFLAWEQIRRDGATVPPFDKFIDKLESVETVTPDGDTPLAESQ